MLGKFVFFFLWEGHGHFWDKDQISSGYGKRGKRCGEEVQNEGYFCKIPIIQQYINFISQTFGQTNL